VKIQVNVVFGIVSRGDIVDDEFFILLDAKHGQFVGLQVEVQTFASQKFRPTRFSASI